VSKDGKKVVIVKKKGGGGHGHHGGSWKVAYADFVTAMMAFFMVLWIVGLDEQTKKAVEGYFQNPVGTKNAYSGGASPIASGASPTKVQRDALKLIVRRMEEQRFKDFQRRLQARIDSNPALNGLERSIEVVVTSEGLRIELVEKGGGDDFFPIGSASMRPRAVLALDAIASELALLENPIVIEGHTDGSPLLAGGGSYTNWELSADRANAARRVVTAAGVPLSRLRQVRGMADTQPRDRDDPLSPTNRRISLLLPFSDDKAADPGAVDSLSPVAPAKKA
jgi:chemotaxis protein MotB